MAGLRDKLNRIATAPAPPQPVDRLERYESSRPVDARLLQVGSRALARMGFSAPFNPRRALFLDTETTGLSGGAGTVAFLVGIGVLEEEVFTVRQYLMTGYAAEPMLMEAVAAELEGKDTFVTFNGRTFDAPLLESRFTMCRMKSRLGEMEHLDLLHPSRRLWKLRLSSCRLSHLEEKVLGIQREGDLPGAEVPERYFAFLKSRDMRLLDDIVEHNRQDIFTLGTLLVRLCEAYDEPLRQESMLDVFSAGYALERQGELSEARECYRMAARPRPVTSLERMREARCAGEANWRLSHLYRRSGETAEAERVWREMERKGQKGELPLIELAKLAEHTKKDAAVALELSERAMAMAKEEPMRAQIQRRMDRLNRKLGR